MERLGTAALDDADCYLTGGATAVLVGWRESTIDVDLSFVPEHEPLLRALAELKNELEINVELVGPGDFVPLPRGWEERSLFAAREGRVTFRHVDPYAQALAKIERSHARDVEDVAELGRRGLIRGKRLLELFAEIEDELFRYPAVDPATFRRAVEATSASLQRAE